MFALAVDALIWFYPLLLTSLAALLESQIELGLFPDLNPVVLVITFPILYLIWLLLFAVAE